MDDWRGRLILRKLEEGCTVAEAAGITRRAVQKRIHRWPSFAEAVQAARAVGEAERKYRLWLRHPCRGKRLPTGKGHGWKPGYSYGRL